ncbi:MAG: AI-2E family transporter [Eggerthellales bacterium]|nr:AI-2E family transporter [Eggerthellales bacterium]
MATPNFASRLPQTKEESKRLLLWIAIIAAAVFITCVLIIKCDRIISAVKMVISVLSPFVAGAIIAYLVNLLSSAMERIYFPKTKAKALLASRRPVCVTLAFLVLIGIAALTITIASRELVASVTAIMASLSNMLQALSEFEAISEIDGLSSILAGNFQVLQEQITTQLANGINTENLEGVEGVVSGVVDFGTSVAHGMLNALIALVFSIYLIIGKDRAVAGARTMCLALFPDSTYRKIHHVVRVFDTSFSSFISGQCLEACILGTLCAIGMVILGLPNAASIGLVVGVSSLIPLLGAWIGGIVGVLLIASTSVKMAIIFVVFLIILQQIEGHFIYPNVVGSSVGVSSIWVLFAVFVGGTLWGIIGILFSVPLIAALQTLILEWLEPRRRKDPLASDSQQQDEAPVEAPSAAVQ